MATNRITSDEWIAELDRLASISTQADSDLLTVVEMCEQSGYSKNKLLRYLKSANKAGRLIVGRKQGIDIAGRDTSMPAYKIISEQKKK